MIVLLAMVIVTACNTEPKERDPKDRTLPDMSLDFNKSSTKPMGLHTAYRLTRAAFPYITVTDNKKPFKDFFTNFTKDDYSRNKNAYTIISNNFLPNEEDIDAMDDFVKNGNTLFIAANHFDQSFLEKFHLTLERGLSMELENKSPSGMVNSSISMTDFATSDTSSTYGFYFYPFNKSIHPDDSFTADTLANSSKRPTALVFKHGSGQIIAVTNANAFSNYFLLTESNYQYLLHLLSYIPADVGDITWDTYYTRLNEVRSKDFSSFGELMKHPALVWALWLFILLLVAWIINGFIRKQRAVPVIKPNVNSSVEFGETVARLYLLKKDNKNIATKMVTYFLEQVRGKYYIGTSTLNNDFAQLLSAKSGVSHEKTQMLLHTINQIQAQDNITDYMLLDLNGQLKQFLK